MNHATIGSIGVSLADTRKAPRLFKLLDIPHRMGFAYFEPLDDPGATIAFPLRDFWVLLDRLQ